MLNISQIVSGISSNVGMGLVITTTTLISSTAAFKLADTMTDSKPTVDSRVQIEVTKQPNQVENGMGNASDSSTDSGQAGVITTDPINTSTSPVVVASASSNGVFDAAALAQHNKAGNCYIAYSGKVYNVSNHPSWSNCWHHGISGGQDITSRFPHSTSYLASLPIMGTYTGTTTAGGGNNGGGSSESDDDNNSDDKEENEEHNEKPKIEEHNQENENDD
jgi:predicted heme/steroid binding protein